MKYDCVFTKKEFPNNGETTVLWHKVGIIKTTKNGGRYLQLFHLPDIDFYIFEPAEEQQLPDVQIAE